jgi:hypothetical protein
MSKHTCFAEMGDTGAVYASSADIAASHVPTTCLIRVFTRSVTHDRDGAAPVRLHEPPT